MPTLVWDCVWGVSRITSFPEDKAVERPLLLVPSLGG